MTRMYTDKCLSLHSSIHGHPYYKRPISSRGAKILEQEETKVTKRKSRDVFLRFLRYLLCKFGCGYAALCHPRFPFGVVVVVALDRAAVGPGMC
jgi:hypothetical protein